MSEKRIGRQTPTTSLVLPYIETKGKEAVEIYNKTGRTAREWQELLNSNNPNNEKCPFYGRFFIAENVLKTFHKIQFSLVFTFLSKIYEKLAKFTGNS